MRLRTLLWAIVPALLLVMAVALALLWRSPAPSSRAPTDPPSWPPASAPRRP